MAAEQGLWWWPLPALLAGSSAAWFVVLNVVVGAIVVLWSRAGPSSPSPRRGAGVTRRASSSSLAVLQRLRSSFSIFSFPSLGFHTAPLDQPAEQQTPPPDTAAPQTPLPPQKPSAVPEMLASPATEEKEEEYDENSMSMDEAYAWAMAARPPSEEEEAGWSEVDAKAEEFIREFKDDLRQQRLDSIYNYTQMLKRTAAAAAAAAAAADDMRKQRLDSITNYTKMLKQRGAELPAVRR